jgi:hypothetical protein
MFGIGFWEIVLIGGILAVPLVAGLVGLVVVLLGQRSLKASANATNCPGCGHFVSRRATVCPQCGRPL